MRMTFVVAAASVLVCGQAQAQPAEPAPDRVTQAQAALSRLLRATVNDDPRALVPLMDASVIHDVDAPACGKAFRRAGAARGAARLRLARCLVKLPWPTSSESLRVVDEGEQVRLELSQGGDRWIVVYAARGASPTLIAVRYGRSAASLRAGAGDRHYDLLATSVDLAEGEVGGVPDGELGGAVATPVMTTAATTTAPRAVALTLLEANRLAGGTQLVADEAIRAAIAASGKDRLQVRVKVCVDAGGAVTDATVLARSGFPAFDEEIARTVRATWRFRPIVVDGKAAAVCTVAPFMYRVVAVSDGGAR